MVISETHAKWVKQLKAAGGGMANPLFLQQWFANSLPEVGAFTSRKTAALREIGGGGGGVENDRVPLVDCEIDDRALERHALWLRGRV